MEITREQLLKIYNSGYHSGHNDTVESIFRDDPRGQDCEYHHGDAINELIEDIIKEKIMKKEIENTNIKDTFKIMDEFACESLPPEVFDKWSAVVRSWDEHTLSLKGCKKDYHESRKEDN